MPLFVYADWLAEQGWNDIEIEEEFSIIIATRPGLNDYYLEDYSILNWAQETAIETYGDGWYNPPCDPSHYGGGGDCYYFPSENRFLERLSEPL